MSDIVHGTCSICGGRVTSPAVWWGINLPIPSCESCGALPANVYGPVIEMKPARPFGVTTTTKVRFTAG